MYLIEMILRIFTRGVFGRNASSSPVHWAVCLKLNQRIEFKLFHASSNTLISKKNLETINTENTKVLKVWKNITPRELTQALNITLEDLQFLWPNFNIRPDDKIQSLAVLTPLIQKLGCKIEIVKKGTTTTRVVKEKTPTSLKQPQSKPENLVKRPPVVTVMGHVDHGKTTLLDALRNTSVVEQEFGGITQHIGAFSVEVNPGETITFIDTPGHAAFTTMRSRGAKVTDLVVLVIAADDGIMDQTIESIKIAQEAKVPIIVAVNKIDKPSTLPIDEIKRKLLWEGVQVEDQGGDIQLVPISALKKINLDLLKEVILLQAELMELKGDPTGLVEAVVIESKKEKSGFVATLIIKRGTLEKGKIIIAGTAHARVRRMLDENGRDYKKAPPSTPVQVLGWRNLPTAGDTVLEVESEKKANVILREREKKILREKRESEKDVIERKAAEDKQKFLEIKGKIKELSAAKEKKAVIFEMRQSLRNFNKKEDRGPHLNILLKADVFGSLEVIYQIFDSYNKHNECELSIVSASVGQINPGDIETATSFDALIYAFNVNMHESAEHLLEEKPVDIRYHNILYKLIDDVKQELTMRIPPVDKEEINGEAEVLKNFIITHNKKKVPVAGARCVKGQLIKDSLYKIYRDNELIYNGALVMMKNEKIEVKTISKGTECGLLFDSFPGEFKPGDKIVSYSMIKVQKNTTWDPGF